ADDADWLIVGPIELFPYCGQHLGKDAVLAAYQRMNESAAVSAFTRDYMVTDGESASALSRITSVERATGRQVMVRLAQFARHGAQQLLLAIYRDAVRGLATARNTAQRRANAPHPVRLCLPPLDRCGPLAPRSVCWGDCHVRPHPLFRTRACRACLGCCVHGP